MWCKINKEFKRKRETSIIYLEGSQEWEDVQAYFVDCFEVAAWLPSNNGFLYSNDFSWKDVPHWDKVEDKKASKKVIQDIIESIIPCAQLSESYENTFYLTIMTEEEVDKLIQKAQETIVETEKELAKLKKLKE